MGVVVVDNSALLPLFLADETDDHSQAIIASSGAGKRLIAPTLCLLEFGNAILKAVRQKRLTGAEATFAHHKFLLLPIEFRDFVGAGLMMQVHDLAHRRNLSFYDATYLALAMEEGANLASLDGPLLAAARAEGVEVEGP